MSDDVKPTQNELDAVADLDDVLDDPSMWIDPPAALQEQIVAAITAASGTGGRRRRWSLPYTLVGAAAVVALVLGVVVGLSAIKDNKVVQYSAALSATDLAPAASGKVTLTKHQSGWQVYLEAKGLPRRSDGSYYEAWLKSPDGSLVPVGTFNEGMDVTLWSGVPPTTHPTFTITRQLANGDPKSTGEVVLKGQTHLK